MKLHKIAAATAAATALFLIMDNTLHDAHAHSTVDRGATIKDIGKYQIAFQLYPKFAIAGQTATLHFSVMDKNNSNVNGVHAALVMKEKESNRVVEQMPYRFYEAGDISVPYKFHNNEDHVATLLTRINGDAKHMATPLQADFDIPVWKTTMSLNDLLPMVIPFTAALTGGIILLFKKRWI